MSYELGSLYRTSLEVLNTDGDLADPSEITLTITLPDRTTETPVTAHDGVGEYHYDYTFAQEGLHKFSWVTSAPTTHNTDYANAAEWRSIIGIDEARDFVHEDDTTKDALLRRALATATELAEKVVGICVIRDFTSESIPGRVKPVLRLRHGPLPDDSAIDSITSVWPGGPTWETSDLIIYPDSATCEPLDGAGFWYGPWKATYTAGRTMISSSIQYAVNEIVYDLWSIQRSFGAVDLEPGPEDTARWEQMLATYKIPPHAEAMLKTEAQPGFA